MQARESGDRTPPPSPLQPPPPSVAGMLCKWTNIGKGWRPRWFAILAYAKIRRRSRTKLLAAPIDCLPLKLLNADDTANISEPRPHLMEAGYSCSGHANCSERSNTKSSDHVEQQELDEELDEVLDQDDNHFYDTQESFSDSAADLDLKMKNSNSSKDNCQFADKFILPRAGMGNCVHMPLSLKRRTKLPEPVEMEKGVSLWSLIKDNVGNDLTRVCLPDYFNEPLSSLQKCFEDLEYSYLLDCAYKCGLKGNSLMRILYVAAFAVSGYASSDGRPCKAFNPLLGETYEADYPENGIRFFSEKVSSL
ncbi:hypothetical protein PR202_ga27389 [Eleusine coracana subsp. coracana]|uniref:Uncharacterized protein n=1 Tax=Eleusine coracana subsp. coracana TaxID=191504 RepID=A0AAV5DGR0_ELECO|nr:hypothetical protein PR202_ga27389 [Eleusine coracana subsp. coracana]